MYMKLFSRIDILNKFQFFKYSAVVTQHKQIIETFTTRLTLTDEPDTKLLTNNLDKCFNKTLCSNLKQNAYITDVKEAESIASFLTAEWNGGYILEANPGPGVLTRAVLNNGVNHLRIFEKNEEFLPLLKALSIDHPILEVVENDLLFLPSLESRMSKTDSNVYDNFFGGIPEYDWENGIPCRIFSIIYNKTSVKFLRYLLAVLPIRTSLFSFGRCEFFLLLKEREYLYMIAEPKVNFATYRWTTVLYNLFFDIKYLKKYSSEIFHPHPSQLKKKATKEQHFYLVKLAPKSDLFSFVVNDNKLPDFYFFVRRQLIKRSGFVIPTLEGWIPSCGPRLIKEGMNVFTKFGDLSPGQILELFNQFSSWPEYEVSSFCVALHRYYNKSTKTMTSDE